MIYLKLKTEEPFIEIAEHQDMITPLVVLEFLQVVKDIVRKGLKKGYYREQKNLYAKVKGKVIGFANNKTECIKK